MRGYGSRAYAISTQRFFTRAQKLHGGGGGDCPQLLAKFDVNTQRKIPFEIGSEEVGQLSRDIFRPMILRYFLSASKRPVD